MDTASPLEVITTPLETEVEGTIAGRVKDFT